MMINGKNMLNRKKQKAPFSLKRKLAIVFVVIMLSSILITWLINYFFLEKIYISNKEQGMFKVYEQMVLLSSDGTITSDEYDNSLKLASSSYNVGILIISSLFEPIKVYSNEDKDDLIRELRLYLSGQITVESVVMETNEYMMIVKKDDYSKMEYLEMIGMLPDNSFFIIRTALESIRQSAKLASKVFLLIGLGMSFVSVICIYFIVGKITKPILQISDIAERVSLMDFTAKYSGKDKNEIGILGNSINKMSDNLERTISELKNANIELQKDIDEKNKIDSLRRDFISNASHELKTPIALIQGYAEGLKEGINDSEERDYYCDVIIDESGKMNLLVKQMLTLNNLESGNEVLSIDHFDIVALVNNFVQSVDILTRQNDINIVINSNDSIYVWADEFRIEEVITNYISNAINHCESDGEKKILIDLAKTNNVVRVSVFNTGKPIPEESLTHIWENFYKVDKARTRAYGGSGVGLSIVKAIMDLHHQEYGVINKENGVEFYFTLDCSEQ